MLVAVCSRCHDISHGAKEMKALTDASRITLVGPFENSISLYHANGLVWASVEQWCRVLEAPYFMPDFFRRHAEAQLIHLKAGTFIASCGGVTVYRWPPIAATLDLWYRSWMTKVTKNEIGLMDKEKRAASEHFARNIARLKAWGYELQERELQNAMNARMTQGQSTSGLADVNHAINAIQTLATATQAALTKHDIKLTNHETRIDGIERSTPALRDPQAFVTVKQRCLERSLPFAVVVEGRMNLAQACGQYLQRAGMQKGSSQKERLDGSSLMADVATWRRMDIDKAIDSYMPDVQLPNLEGKKCA